MTSTESRTEPTEAQQSLLRKLPGVDSLLETTGADPDFAGMPRSVVTGAIRRVLDDIRTDILASAPGISENILVLPALMGRIKPLAQKEMADNLIPAVNATGVVVHTNLGRSLLSDAAIRHLTAIANRYSNLEFNLATGRRGSRYSAVEDIICEISGAPAAMVVNNNAAAVLLCLDTVARNREVIVSRGELVEIGGSFRIPDVMAKSGAILKEVGTTNRTHPHDYRLAITDQTGLLLKVHTSNFGIVGFTASVSLKELVGIGGAYQLPVMEDLGSGTFIDLSRYGLSREPTVQESVAAGTDLVTFSGDKLLGGPQAGIIVGSTAVIDKIKRNPLTRALRIDKLTLAALESTLRLYRDESGAVDAIPTLHMLTCPISEIEARANRLEHLIRNLNDPLIVACVIDSVSKAGGGSLPLQVLPTKCIGLKIKGLSATRMEERLRSQTPPIIGRIEDDIFMMDMRTVRSDELETITCAINLLRTGI